MKFRYPGLQFWIRYAVQAGLLSVLLLVLSTPEVNMAWLWGFGALGFCLGALVTLSPVLTSHEITGDSVVLRQGALFRTVIPFRDIESVEAIQMRLWAFGMFPAAGTRGRIVLASGTRNLVSIKLKQKRRFGQLLWRSSDEIIIDLNDPDGFVKMANEHI